MRRILIATALFGFLITSPGLIGCGDDAKTGTIQESPEAKKAIEGAMKGQEDFMKTKTVKKK